MAFETVTLDMAGTEGGESDRAARTRGLVPE